MVSSTFYGESTVSLRPSCGVSRIVGMTCSAVHVERVCVSVVVPVPPLGLSPARTSLFRRWPPAHCDTASRCPAAATPLRSEATSRLHRCVPLATARSDITSAFSRCHGPLHAQQCLHCTTLGGCSHKARTVVMQHTVTSCTHIPSHHSHCL